MNLADSILERLRTGVQTTSDLGARLGVGPSTLSRALTALQRDGRVLKIGTTRGARYGLHRMVAGTGPAWPVLRIDAAGAAHELGRLHALEPHHHYFDSPQAALTGLTDGIPYFLQDQRPAGFLGRAVPANHADLQLPQRVQDWTDDHYLLWLTRRGADCVSDLIVGSEAFDRHLESLKTRAVLSMADRPQAYAQLADTVMAHGLPGSSAHGEQPKFTALLERPGQRAQVIVKFSPPDTTAIGQRWSDLLVAEHLAHVHLRGAGIAAAQSTLLRAGGRMFLEVERFDRNGADGRIGVVSLLAVDAARFGRLDNWSSAATRLANHGQLPAADAATIHVLEAFAMLIANIDRHFGNLALFDRYDGRFTLAPVYDMLPMLFAPADGQLVERRFEPPNPTTGLLSAWARALELAEGYWQRVADDGRISTEFRGICARNLAALHASPLRPVTPTR